ncbi:Outer membrane lipoprotein carrier protein LolA OS=Streptomyces fumanus OX=67302 GN=GCM10018772_61300 PE=4 SV=1 [Streptomyces fumanus]
MAAQGGLVRGRGTAAADDGGGTHGTVRIRRQHTAGAAEERRAARGRKATRYAVPVAVIGVAAATIGLVPALADSGDPDLPDITAQQLLEKIAASDTERLSGTVRISTDLGLPDLGGLESGLLSGGPGSPSASGSGDGEDGGSAADPSTKLTELAAGSHTLRVAADGPDREGLAAPGRLRVQPDPRRQGRLGLRQRVQRGLPHHPVATGTGKEREVPPRPATSPRRP